MTDYTENAYTHNQYTQNQNVQNLNDIIPTVQRKRKRRAEKREKRLEQACSFCFSRLFLYWQTVWW